MRSKNYKTDQARAVNAALEKCVRNGMASFGVPLPLTLDQWAREHFYLSAESSYIEQRWRPWWFQRAILSWISNDDIREINLRKSARVGYSKILLAAIGYFAEHKRRNQAIWQPTDDDRDAFVKSELEPMLRDVRVMQNVFPEFLRRVKDNTLQHKKFLGSLLHMKGGKAAKNYRRISIDTAYLDEYDAFDASVEKEGDPGSLASKRIEGATFPKIVVGTTPGLKGFSNIEKRERMADIVMRPMIPCPECGAYHALTWGGKEDHHGFKWTGVDVSTARHLCPHCGALITQSQYLDVADAGTGRWQSDDGIRSDADGIFYDALGNVIRPPSHIAALVWSAYSPNVTWADIVKEFLSASVESKEGKIEKLQAFKNTTLGEYWAESFEKSDEHELMARAEPFPLERCPAGCLLLLAGVDTQDNRLEVVVWGYGRGCEMWSIAHRVFFGNPQEDDVWHSLEDFLFNTEFPHETGAVLRISGVAQDSKGHNTHAVYNFAAKHSKRKFFAVAGRSGKEKHIRDGASKVDIDWRGRQRKSGLVLWWVGTNHAKDLIHGRLRVIRPGPGYVHLSNELTEEFFKQLTGEARTTRRTARGDESIWTATRPRVEALDCTVYTIWLENYFELYKKSARYWDDLETRIRGQIVDSSTEHETEQSQDERIIIGVKAPARSPTRNVARSGIGSDEWAGKL